MLKRTLLTLATAVILGSVAAPAEATRVSTDAPDVCKNRGEYAMPGKQTVADVLSPFLDYADPYQESNRFGRRDCVVAAVTGRRR